MVTIPKDDPLSQDDPLAVAAVRAIQTGDVARLKRMLDENPSLARARLRDPAKAQGQETFRTLLHVATDWPGGFPHVAESIAALVAAGADVNARFEGPHRETPLHWAASSGDMAALEALLEHGADIEAPGAVIGGGSPIADAAAFGNWPAARRLLENGAQTPLWVASALGLLDRVQGHFASAPLPPWSPRGPDPKRAPPDEITHAFWSACHGGQRATAEYLLERGADIQWLGYDHLTPLGAARRAGASELVAWLIERGAR